MLLAATVVAASCSGGSGDDRSMGAGPTTSDLLVESSTDSAVPASHPRGPVADCSSRSWADFTGAFSDPANLTIGPLVLVGAGALTPAAVVESIGGNKFPLLVRQGHVVTVRVPANAQRYAALGYGPLPQGEIGVRDGHATVTFVACTAEEPSGSIADGPATFWSGFVLARRPACVPLDVYVDDEPAPRRAEIELGRPC